MRNRILFLLVPAWLLVFAAAPAFAQGPALSLTIKIAIDPSIGGTVLSAGNAVISSVPASITETPWTDSHSKNSPLFVVDVGFPVASRVEVLGGLEYGRAGADLVTIGSVPSGPLTASFDAYEFWGLEGGVRVGLRQGRGPYGAVSFGFRNVSDLSAILTAPGLTATRDVYDGSSVPTFGFSGGFVFGTGAGLGIGLEVGVKYAGSPKAAAGSPELSAVDGTGERWSLPIGIVLGF